MAGASPITVNKENAWRLEGREPQDWARRLPLNTNGEHIGEAHIHGFNGIAEAVRQVCGTAVDPVAGVEDIVATSGAGVPPSSFILGHV